MSLTGACRHTCQVSQAILWLVVFLWMPAVTLSVDIARADSYELTTINEVDLEALRVTDISLFGVKLNDPARKASTLLLHRKISGIQAELAGLGAEQGHAFIFLFDPDEPTGPMAGIELFDEKVNLIFINKRFARKVPGIFRIILEGGHHTDLHRLLPRTPGILVNHVQGDVNVEFTLP